MGEGRSGFFKKGSVIQYRGDNGKLEIGKVTDPEYRGRVTVKKIFDINGIVEVPRPIKSIKSRKCRPFVHSKEKPGVCGFMHLPGISSELCEECERKVKKLLRRVRSDNPTYKPSSE